MNQTIVAPMTVHGVSAIAALRVSGPAVRQVLVTLFNNENPIPRHAYYGNAVDPHTQKTIDSLLYLFLILRTLTQVKTPLNFTLTGIL